jgi:hypothetical protein
MKKYKANIDTKCSFCEFHSETVFHLFWTCHYTVQLWKHIGSFINENIQQDVSITFKGIMFGHYESDSTKSNACFIIKKNVFVNFTFTNVNLPTTNRILLFCFFF